MTVAGCPTSDTRKCYQKTNKTPSVNIGFSATNALKKKIKKMKNQLWMLQRLIILGKMQKP